MTSLNVDGVECVTWKECASKLMEKFFPAAGMNVQGCSEDETEGMKDKCFDKGMSNGMRLKKRL